MNFLTPWSALFAAAITIPVLLLLYLLKLRRTPLRIPSTLLWKQSFEDLQANAPFQRLRFTPLLLIQFLLLASLLLALAQPVLEGGAQPSSRIILLIDVSASMASTDVESSDAQRSRLDEALDEARTFIKRISRADRATQIMIAAFSRSPRVITSFESNRGILLEALTRIEQTDEQANLAQALRLADAFASRAERDDEPPEVILISDGGVGLPDNLNGFDLRTGSFRYVRAGPALDTPINNIGITAFTARRDYENPAQVDIFVRLSSACPTEIELVVTIRADGVDPLPLIMTIPPATETSTGERSFTAALELPGHAVLTLTHNHRDALASDNAAALVLPAPRQPRLAMVHPDDEPEADPFIIELLRAADPQQLDIITAQQFASREAGQNDIQRSYDLIVFDRVSPQRLLPVPTLTFGAAPPTVDIIEPVSSAGQSVLSWDRQHPLMQYVELDAVRYANFTGLVLPTGAMPLAWGPGGPIIAVLRARNVEHVVVGFELRHSDWPLNVSFAVFMQNVLDQLALASRSIEAISYVPGESIAVLPEPEATEIIGSGPMAFTMAVTSTGLITLPPIRRAGLYELKGAQQPHDVLAVNVLSDVETDTRPVNAIRVNAETASAKSASDTAAQPLWPWLIALATVLAVLEWLAWCARARR